MREGRNHNRAWWVGGSLIALVSGCSLGNPALMFPGDTGTSNPPDVAGDTGTDVPVDTAVDAGADVPIDRPDAGLDVPIDMPDTGLDVPIDMPDTGPDVQDAGADVPDVPVDTGVDVPDVPVDTGVDVPDVPVDTGVDVPDVPVDTGVDVPDVPVDTGVDVPDVPVDTGVDVPVDVPPTCPTGQSFCGGACVDTTSDTNRCGGCTTVCPSGQFCQASACRAPRDCREVLTRQPSATSGLYTVDLDGAGAGAPIAVRCDMVTHGGGWTMVFDSSTSANYNQPDVPWSRADVAAGLIATSVASEVLIAHRNATFVPIAGVSTAHFALPDTWRTRTPFAGAGRDDTVMAYLDGSTTPVMRRLRYGNQYFVGSCAADWDTTATFGRLCLLDTSAPFYSTFANSTVEYCATSAQAWYGVNDPSRCSDSRRFTIFVR